MSRKLSQLSSLDIAQILFNSWNHAPTQSSFEDMAQECVSTLYDEFQDSIVLTRAFLTVPFKKLPDSNQQWVLGLAEKTGVVSRLNPDTPVLSLVSTAGVEKDWNDRRVSQGHVGIPLVSSTFINNIPMMLRLMGQITGSLHWLDTQDWDAQRKVMGKFSGIFFVPDAFEEKDEMGRHVIAGQDFVKKYGVRSVFGIGGGYEEGAFAVLLVFTRELLDKAKAVAFLPPFNAFRSITTPYTKTGTIFNP
jgi:hypothetical protein